MSDRSQMEELSWLRQHLGDIMLYADDAELRTQVREWLEDAKGLSAGSVAEHVETQLSQLHAENPMHWSMEHHRGEQGFPAGCQGCPHYGSSCPIIKDREQRRRRERELDTAESPEEAKRALQQLATDNSCHRIPGWIAEFEEQNPVIERGYELLSRGDEAITDANREDAGVPDEVEKALGEESVLAGGEIDG